MSMKTITRIFDSLPKILIDSVTVAFAVLGGISIVFSFTSYSLEKIGKLPLQIILVLTLYIVIVIITVYIKREITKNEITLYIRGMKVVVREGDLLTAEGWKLIPFNEYFDTQVDDIIIAHSSLNGKYIDSLSDDERAALINAIESDNSSPLIRYFSTDGTKTKYELGTIKVFREIMMLALTHFNEQNEAHTNRAEYEHTLRNMWREIGRTHQGKSINIPLIGGGLTRLDDMTDKPSEQLLKCILCTFSTSNVVYNENVQINIVLTKKALKSIDLYELKRWQ